MSASVIKVVCIPAGLLDAMRPHVDPLLERGLSVATDCTVDGIWTEAKAGRARIWAVFDEEAPANPCAAFMTALCPAKDGDSASYVMAVWVVCLGGKGLRRWVRQVADAVAGAGIHWKCSRLHFHGRRAWSRVLPEFKMTKSVEFDAYRFERKLP